MSVLTLLVFFFFFFKKSLSLLSPQRLRLHPRTCPLMIALPSRTSSTPRVARQAYLISLESYVRVPATGRTAPSSERQVVSSCNQASERMDWGRHVANDAITGIKSTVTTPICGYFMRVDANDRKSSPRRRTTGLKILVTARQTPTEEGGKVRSCQRST